jgi:hypothetical protein
MTLTLRIEHDNGTTNTLEILGSDAVGDDDLPSLVSVRKERSILREPDQTDQCDVTVYRGAWNDVRGDLDNIDDKFFVAENGTDIFGGRLHDWAFEGAVVSIKLHGPKQDALGATPSSGAEVYQPQGDDSLVKNELLSRVGTVSAGTVTQQNGSIAFEESHSSPGKSITKLAETTGSETVYQPDFTLDYDDSLGTDRTGTTLSPSSQTVLGSPRIQRREKEDFTHIRVLGSQNGSTQFQAERTIDGTTTREKWGLFAEKDAQSQDRVDALADEIQSELQSSDRHIEVEMDIAGSVAPELGDEFTVTLPEYSINTTLRALRVTRILDDDGDRYSCLFSNRRLARELQGERQARSTDSFDSGNPGQYYALADGEGWDAVNNSESYEFSFYRPGNTIAEYRAKLQLESREYRLRASQVGHTHDVDVTHPSHTHSVSGTTAAAPATTGPELFRSGGTILIAENTTGNVLSQNSTSTSAWPYFVFATVAVDSSESADMVACEITLKAPNFNGGTTWVLSPTSNSTSRTFARDSGNTLITQDISNETLNLEAAVTYDGATSSQDLTFSWGIYGIDPHKHGVSETSSSELGTTNTETSSSTAAVDPGINTISGETVSNVSVDIGGTTVASGLSHSDLSGGRTIDIESVLANGSNPVTITSDTLGELRATIEYEGLKNATQ